MQPMASTPVLAAAICAEYGGWSAKCENIIESVSSACAIFMVLPRLFHSIPRPVGGAPGSSGSL